MANSISQVLVIDDHPLYRDALVSALKLNYPGTATVEANDIDEAIAALSASVDIDIALLDLSIPGVQGFEGLMRIRALHPRLPVLIVSGLENNQIIDDSMTYGAAGFLPKSASRELLPEAIRVVLEGGIYVPDSYRAPEIGPGEVEKADLVQKISTLTPQQTRVLFMLREGLLNKQIAYELGVGATTVKKHVSEILRKLSVHSRTQAVIEVSKLDQDPNFKMAQPFLHSEAS